MQPYLFPYIGYFQLMNAVDIFVIYDNIQYTKKGWINRNRILSNGKAEYISLPLRNAPHHLDVKDRFLADNWPIERTHLRNVISESYRKAPHFEKVYQVIEECLSYEGTNLFEFILNSLKILKEYLGINATLEISSNVNIDHSLKGKDRVIEICKALTAANYLNPIGGTRLYKKDQFEQEGIQLSFIKSENVTYWQFNNEFIPFLSIVDVMMFNDVKKIGEFLGQGFRIE